MVMGANASQRQCFALYLLSIYFCCYPSRSSNLRSVINSIEARGYGHFIPSEALRYLLKACLKQEPRGVQLVNND